MKNACSREILCVDMDSFFMSVEAAVNPSLKGKAAAVVGSSHRSVIVSASYEARARGVKTGMNFFEAERKCPGITLVPARSARYCFVSSKIAEFLCEISPDAAMYSIDEAFLDITGTGISADEASFVIKSRILRDFGITCTVGAGPNKLIAKMATRVNKPDGYYRVLPEEALSFIDAFKLKDIWGIGRRYAAKFASMGIFTPKDLRMLGERELERTFGIPGIILFRLVSGQSEDRVSSVIPAMKSVGHSMTFPSDVSSREELYPYLLQLSEMVSSRARRNFYSGSSVRLTVRYPDMIKETFARPLSFRTCATHHIYECAVELLRSNVEDNSPLRLAGITLGKLDNLGSSYANLEDFLSGRQEKKKCVYEAMDAINAKFGERTISYASVMRCRRKGNSVISPSWRPSGPRSIDMES